MKRIETNYEKLYIKGEKSGSATVTLTCDNPITVNIISYTNDLTGSVSINTTGNNTNTVNINVEYADLYLNGETYSGVINASTSTDQLSIPIIINCSDTLIYTNIPNNVIEDVSNGFTIEYNSLPEVNSVKLVYYGLIEEDVTNQLVDQTLHIPYKAKLNSLKYVIASNGLSRIATYNGRYADSVDFEIDPNKNLLVYENVTEGWSIMRHDWNGCLVDDMDVRNNIIDPTVNGIPAWHNHAIVDSPVDATPAIFQFNISLSPCGYLKRTFDFDRGYPYSEYTKLTNVVKFKVDGSNPVTDMTASFKGCEYLQNVSGLAYLDTSKVTRIDSLFTGCYRLKSIPLLDFSSVEVSSAAFERCQKLTHLGGFKNMKVTLDLSDSPLLTHESLMNVINNLAYIETYQELILHPDSLAKLSEDEIMIAVNKGWYVQGWSGITDLIFRANVDGYNAIFVGEPTFNQIYVNGVLTDLTRHEDIGYFDEEIITYGLDMIYGEEYHVHINDAIYGVDYILYSDEYAHDIEPSGAPPSLVRVDRLFSAGGDTWDDGRLFWRMRNLETVRSIIFANKITNLECCFDDCPALRGVYALRDWDVSSVTNMNWVFGNNTELSNINPLYYWDVSSVTTMNSMFYGCSSLTDISPLANWDISSVESLSRAGSGGLFAHCTSLIDIRPLANWNTSNVKYMDEIFEGCSSLSYLYPLANWNTSNVRSMTSTFAYCSLLTDLTPLANWNTSNVRSMEMIFFRSTALSDISPLANWNTSNVNNMQLMFAYCSSLSDASALSNWDTSLVTNMLWMFYDCTSLTAVPLLDTSNVTSIGGMFDGCSSLTNLGGFKNMKVTLDLSDSPLLTHESLMNVINNLAESTATLTLGETNLNKLTDEEKAIAIDKGWSLT